MSKMNINDLTELELKDTDKIDIKYYINGKYKGTLTATKQDLLEFLDSEFTNNTIGIKIYK
jgi:hypothetical protein